MAKVSDKDAQAPTRIIVESLGHPLVLLILGSLLTYIVAPIIVDGINDRKLIQEAKQKKALEVWQHNTEFNSKLNSLKTMLESYHNQSVRLQLAPDDFKEAQKEFRRDFTKRYLELDEIALWWFRDLQREANNQHLVPESHLPALNSVLEEYNNNVVKSILTMKPMWKLITSNKYLPNEAETDRQFNELLKAPNDELPDLFNKRSEIIKRVTGSIISQ